MLVIDGTHMGKHLLVIAMGIDADGVKHVLGVVEGTTESSTSCAGRCCGQFDLSAVMPDRTGDGWS